MIEQRSRASDYHDAPVDLVRATCLYIATRLGDLLDDTVVVGGLVPFLLIDQASLPDQTPPYVGTMDLDLGLALALLDEERYRNLTERLRSADFCQDRNENGQPTRQRWKMAGTDAVTIDFLIPPSNYNDRGGSLRNIERDFAAVIVPGLDLAFRDRIRITIRGITILGEKATRDIWVCGPGAFIVLKALAFDGRGENKDAYDLYYFIRNYGAGIDDVITHLLPLLESPDAQSALEILHRDFLDQESVGPRRVANFIQGRPDDEIQADVISFIRLLLDGCKYL